MSIRRLLRVILRIVTCAVGGLLAGLVVFGAEEVFGGDLRGDLDIIIDWTFLVTGLFSGISWAIEHQKARRRFIISPVTGAVLGGICAAIVGNVLVLIIAVLVGLFVGTVSALAAVGAFRSK